MPAEGALQDLPALGAVEERAPLLEFVDAVGRFLRMELRHAPVVQKLAAAHGVAEMGVPVVGGVHVAHGRGDAAFGHDGVGLAQQRLADQADLGSVRQCFDGGAKARASGADDQDIVFVGFVFVGHSIRISRMAPLASRRT